MAPPRSVLDDLPFCFARATLAFRRISDETLGLVGLDSLAPGLASVMHGLDELGDCSVNALVAKTHLPNGTLTGLLDTLERTGNIRRIRNPNDGRSWILQLTRRGRAACAKLRSRHQAVMGLLGEVMSNQESAELVRLLEKLTAHMRQAIMENEEPAKATPAAKVRRVRPKRSSGAYRHSI